MSVNLQKGQKISLEKEAGGALSRVTMGLGWSTWTLPSSCSTRATARSTWSGSAS